MSREHLIELAGTLQAMRAYLMEHGARYKPAADALIDVLVQLGHAAEWRDWELRRIGRVGTEIVAPYVAYFQYTNVPVESIPSSFFSSTSAR